MAEQSYFDKAVEAAAEVHYEVERIGTLKDWPKWGEGDNTPGLWLNAMRGPVKAAEPFIREDERARLREALLSDEAIEAVKERWFDASSEGDDTYVARALVEAALSTHPERTP